MNEIRHTQQPTLPDASDPVPVNPFGSDVVAARGLCSYDSQGFWQPSVSCNTSASELPSHLEFQVATHGSDRKPGSPASPTAPPASPSHAISSPQMIQTPTIEHFLSKNDVDKQKSSSCVWSGVKYYIDYMAGFLVFLNTITMLVELQVEGNKLGERLGLGDAVLPDSLNDTLPTMRVLHMTFMFMFVLEWILRIVVERRAFVKDYANWFDTVMVMLSIVDVYLTFASVQNDGAAQGVIILRLMRALKSLRAIRIVRSLRLFRGLRVLVRACTCFLPSLCWSMVLLGIFMCLGALMMGNLLQSFIEDESQALEDREWIWDRYGTAYRSWYTLFEITFAGNWPTNVRPVLERVNHAFVCPGVKKNLFPA
ncbi:Cacna1i [Symbiodinium natans]|uniref:Cacna1i protein n=1 Tax=Symbiodinium natans TaxID=878477 RepID=A0A812ICX6_9DINO|nr:Cacna1i [Symbiodinium natans]